MNDFELLEHLVEELSQQPMKQHHVGALRRLMQAQKPTDETEHLLSSAIEKEKQLRENIAQFKAQQKPTVFLTETIDSVIISSYPEEHKDAERYSFDIIGLSGAGTKVTPGNTGIILRNILERAGIIVVLE
jgi:hypothetical protein